MQVEFYSQAAETVMDILKGLDEWHWAEGLWEMQLLCVWSWGTTGHQHQWQKCVKCLLHSLTYRVADVYCFRLLWWRRETLILLFLFSNSRIHILLPFIFSSCKWAQISLHCRKPLRMPFLRLCACRNRCWLIDKVTITLLKSWYC